MCYRNSQTASAEKLERRFKAKATVPFEPVHHANAFAYPIWPIVTEESPAQLQPFHWGLVPAWAKSEEDAKRIRTGTHNAKSETAFELPSFKNAIRSRRCLVPSTGFFEYRDVDKKKYPYFISLKDSPLFAMAGIYESWRSPASGAWMHTFSILTTEANPLMAQIHNLKKRMPVVLPPHLEAEWLSPSLSQADIKSILQPLASNYFQAHTVSNALLAANANVPEVIQEFIYSELKPIEA